MAVDINQSENLYRRSDFILSEQSKDFVLNPGVISTEGTVTEVIKYVLFPPAAATVPSYAIFLQKVIQQDSHKFPLEVNISCLETNERRCMTQRSLH